MFLYVLAVFGTHLTPLDLTCFCVDTVVRQSAMVLKCGLLIYYKNSRGRNYRRQVLQVLTCLTADSYFLRVMRSCLLEFAMLYTSAQPVKGNEVWMYWQTTERIKRFNILIQVGEI